MRIGRKIQRDTGRQFQKQRGTGQASNTDRQTDGDLVKVDTKRKL